MKTRLLLATGMLFLLAACSETINGKGVAEPEVQRFYQRMKARQFESIYDHASADFKGAISKEKAIALFGAVDRKLGALQDTKQINWNVNTHNFNTVVVLVQASKYADGEATETFTFRVDGEKAELIGYNISSLDMLIK